MHVKVTVLSRMRQTLALRVEACLRPITTILPARDRWQLGIQKDKNLGLGVLFPQSWRKGMLLRTRFDVVPSGPEIANQRCLARRAGAYDHNAWALLSSIIHAKISA
jgi:hypothetical protein